MEARFTKVAQIGLLLIACTMSNVHSQCSDVSILRTGLFHSGEVSAAQAGNWLGLIETPRGWEIRPVDVKIEHAYDGIVGDDRNDPSKWTGWKVAADCDVAPLFLIRGLPGANRGLVKTLFVGEIMVMPNSPLALGQRGSNGYLNATGKRSSNGYSILDYVLLLRVGIYSEMRSQVLVSAKGADPSEDSIKVLWVGDLDADGKLDLLLNTGNHYNVIEYSLYLSSCAQDDELVRCVARFRSVGC